MPCPHNNVQQFTEICLSCGANIYETPEERVRRLRQKIAELQREDTVALGDRLEAEYERMRSERMPDDPQNEGGW